MKIYTRIVTDWDGNEILNDWFSYEGPVSLAGDSSQKSIAQTSTGPWTAQQPYLKQGFAEALKNYNSSSPQFYPGSTVTPFSSQTQQGMQRLESTANSSQLPGEASSQLGSTMGGAYLSSPESWASRLTNPNANVMAGMAANQNENASGGVSSNPNVNATNPYADVYAGTSQNQNANATNPNAGAYAPSSWNQNANVMNPYAGVSSNLATNQNMNAANDSRGAFNPYASVGAGVGYNQNADVKADVGFNPFAGVKGNVGLNPYLSQGMNDYIGNVTNAVTRSVVPQVNQGFAAAGRSGESPLAQTAMAKGIADVVAPLQFGSAEAEMARRFSGGESLAGRQQTSSENQMQRLYGAGADYTTRAQGASENQAQRQYGAGADYATRAQSASENQAQRLYGAGSDYTKQLYNSGEALAGRQFAGGESQAARQQGINDALTQQLYGAGQEQASRQFSAGQDYASQDQAAREAQAQRLYSSGQTLAGQQFSSGESQASREQAAREAQSGRQFSAGQTLAGQQFGAGESMAARDQGARDALAGRQFSSGESLAGSQRAEAAAQAARQFSSGQSAITNGMSAYDAERARQMQAAGMAPAIDAAQYSGPNAMLQAGAMQDQQNQQSTQESINRFNYDQNLPQQKLADFMSMITGNYGQAGTNITKASASQAPAQTFAQIGQGIGGLLGGGGGSTNNATQAAALTVICTELARAGLLDSQTLSRADSFGARHPVVAEGYRLWAVPIAQRMRNDVKFRLRIRTLAMPFINKLAQGGPDFTPTGIALGIGVGLCWVIGAVAASFGRLSHGAS